MEVHIRPDGYEKLAEMLSWADCNGKSFPDIENLQELYWSSEGEIVCPACLVLLTNREWDEAHTSVLNTVRTVRLVKIPQRPGWWSASFAGNA